MNWRWESSKRKGGQHQTPTHLSVSSPSRPGLAGLHRSAERVCICSQTELHMGRTHHVSVEPPITGQPGTPTQASSMILTRNVRGRPFPVQSLRGHTDLKLGGEAGIGRGLGWRTSFFTGAHLRGIKSNNQMPIKHLWSIGCFQRQHPES